MDLARRPARAADAFLASGGFDRAPWLAVAFLVGIVAWFQLANRFEWLALLGLCGAVALLALALLQRHGAYPYLRQAFVLVPLTIAAGCLVVWTKSTIVGAVPIDRPVVAQLVARVLDRDERPAEKRVRLVLATREPGTGRAIKVRINLRNEDDSAGLAPGARISVRARLMPPAPPMLPGSHDFARTAWFAGLAATGSAMGPPEVLEPAHGWGGRASLQAALSRHVRDRIDGGAGGIAAALASGDRGAIPEADDAAMRDAGLAHLLSISGLHVSAMVAAAYVIALRLLALSPWLALRVRLPLVAAAVGAVAGIGYTLLTGAEVPTVRSCIGALLVLGALALGRDALSLRMVAIAAGFVMALWPEAVVGPSFQMSFAAVLAIVGLHGAAPIRAFLRPRDEAWLVRQGRNLTMLLLTGVVIELALMPIGLFHFHRAGIYGALANLVAIPLTTVLTMPLLALGLLLDVAGAGAPAWWLAGKTLDLMLAMAHWIASRPGAVTLLPAMGQGAIALFSAGALWLAMWRGKRRLAGLVPMLIAAVMLARIPTPDVLVSGDGRHVGITGTGPDELLVLRGSGEGFAGETLSELAGMRGEVRRIADWPGARCSPDFCVLALDRGGRRWRLLLSRSRNNVPERELAATCDRVDIVIADRRLPRSCQPRWFKADRAMLARTGGLSIDLTRAKVTTVAETQGEHGWWRGGANRAAFRPRHAASGSGDQDSGSRAR